MIAIALDGRPLAITGTDTGMGKTFAACCLVRLLADRGVRVRAVKPVESGCGPIVDPSEDGPTLARAARQTEPAAAWVRLAAPLTPADAADLEGIALDYPSWVARLAAIGGTGELVVFEGAGGLLSPLTWDRTVLDLARDLRGRALLVAADRLGTIGHVRACAAVLAGAGVPCIGVVLSAPAAPDASTGRNAAAIARVLPELPIATLPRSASIDAGAAALAAHVRIDRP